MALNQLTMYHSKAFGPFGIDDLNRHINEFIHSNQRVGQWCIELFEVISCSITSINASNHCAILIYKLTPKLKSDG